jgi:hypothetical protein
LHYKRLGFGRETIKEIKQIPIQQNLFDVQWNCNFVFGKIKSKFSKRNV